MLAAQVAYAAGRLDVPAATAQARRPVTVVGAEQLIAVDRFWLTRHEAVERTFVFAAQVASVAGRLDTPAAAEQACRAVTVVGAEQLTVVFRLCPTRQDAVVRTVGRFAAHSAYDVVRLDAPAAAEQA